MDKQIQKVLSAVRAQYKLTDEFKTIDHQPLVVGFTAVPTSGKTTLSKCLIPLLQATYLCRDEIRALIAREPDLGSRDARSIVLDTINREVFQEVMDGWNNKRIILDCSLDRTYAKTRQYIGNQTPLYLIKIVPIWEEIEQRIFEREGSRERAIKYVEWMKLWRQDWEKLGIEVSPNFIWNQSSVGVLEVAEKIGLEINKRYS